MKQTDPTPYSLHLVSDDPELAPDLLQSVFPSLRVRLDHAPSPPPVPLLQHDVLGDERFTYQRSRFTVPARAAGSTAEMTVVGVRRLGAVRIESDRTPVDTTRPFLHPAGDLESDWDRYDVDLVAVHPSALARAARSITGDERHLLEFTGTAPVSAATERYWFSAARHVASILSDPLMLAEPMLRGEAFRTAVGAMLLAFPNTTMAVEGSTTRPAAGGVDAATSFIEANAGREIDLQDVADAASSAPRPLAQAFRRRHGRTPMQFLRGVRFDHVRQDLAAADPWGPVTGAEVARRWGLVPSGRFAGEYRDRFGEPPSSTLKR